MFGVPKYTVNSWVQFSNGVSVNTHKEFALEILMTMAPILDERVLTVNNCIKVRL
jgi:hypothetical protein